MWVSRHGETWTFTMTEKEKRYRQLLQQHDFYYDMSDDHSVWCRGRDQWNAICELMKEVDPDRKILKEYFNAN